MLDNKTCILRLCDLQKRLPKYISGILKEYAYLLNTGNIFARLCVCQGLRFQIIRRKTPMAAFQTLLGIAAKATCVVTGFNTTCFNLISI